MRDDDADYADYAVVPVPALHGVGVTSLDALIAPMSVESLELQNRVLQGPVIQEMLKGVDAIGLVGNGVVPRPLRRPGEISRKVLVPNDYQGTTIGMGLGDVADRSLRALGATPFPSSFNGSDISQLDGADLQLSGIAGNRDDGVITTIDANVTFWPRPFVATRSSHGIESATPTRPAAPKPD